MRRPSAEELKTQVGRAMPDIIAPNLRVLFCGINPSVYSAVVGHHFARPGNRFWKALFHSGFTPYLFSPDEDESLLDYGLGITNVASPATTAAADLSNDHFISGAQILREKVLGFKPRYLAIIGVSTYRVAFSKPRAVVGPQDETIGDTKIWVLPNPSGLNAHYQIADLNKLYSELREAASG
jgi:TDG/mug DNA glycosylase family protein